MKQFRIGLLGFGTVGSGVYRILEAQRAQIQARLSAQTGTPVDVSIKRILVRNINKYDPSLRPLMTTNAQELLEDPEIDLICELIGGDTLALDLMQRAIAAGKHVVTANKKAIFTCQNALEQQARAAGKAFRYEASVMGVVPIIRVLKESLASDEVLELCAIINGSTNFILTKVSEGASYEEAMAIAQQLGYLEADPSSDVDGYDAMYKLGILTQLATGSFPLESDILRIGIGSITAAQIVDARAKGQKLKLVARLTYADGKPQLSVQPEALDPEHPLYGIDGSLNAAALTMRYAGKLFLSGAGAGSHETATAVLGDILSIAAQFAQ